MKVFIKIIDKDGNQYFYPKDNTATRMYGGWKIPIQGGVPLGLAGVMDDSDENIQYIEQLARQENCTIQLVPIQQVLGTYLSTYTNNYVNFNEIAACCLMMMPLIVILLGYIMQH